MKQKLWLTLVCCISYCINKELYKAIGYLREQVRVLVEQQEKQNKRILLTNSQRMRVAAKGKRLSRRMLERCTVLFTADTIIGWYNKLIAEKYDGSQHRTSCVCQASIGPLQNSRIPDESVLERRYIGRR